MFYEPTYVVNGASPPTNNAPPEMLDLRPAPGSSTQNGAPLIKVRALTQAEETVRRRKEDAEEALRQTELGFEGDLGLAADRVAALALSKVEEIDAFKARLEERFAEGRTSVLGDAV